MGGDRDILIGFLEGLASRHAPGDSAALGRALADIWLCCQRAWPGLPVVERDFGRLLGQRTSGNPGEALEGMHAMDLYLAFACASGSSAAMLAFERRYFGEVADAVSKLDASGSLTEEVQQLLRKKLFVAEGGSQPKVASYSGRGPLGGWVCAAAIRTALSVLRQGRREVGLEDEKLVEAPSDDPELEFIKSRYRQEFREAFQAAFRTLTPQERNVLRMNLLDGLNIDEIGAVYRAHRSTVARWIARARQTLFDETRQALVKRFRLTPSELDSLMRLLNSDLDLSIGRFLRDTGAPG